MTTATPTHSLTALLAERGWSTRQLAQKANVTLATAHAAAGKTPGQRILPASADQIADVFGLTATDLFGPSAIRS